MSALGLALALAAMQATPQHAELVPLPLPPVAVVEARGGPRLEFSIMTTPPEHYDPRWGTIYAVAATDAVGGVRRTDSRSCPQIAGALGEINGFFLPRIDAGMPFMTAPQGSGLLPPGLPPPPALDGLRVTVELNAIQPGGQPARLTMTANSGPIVELYRSLEVRLEPCLAEEG